MTDNFCGWPVTDCCFGEELAARGARIIDLEKALAQTNDNLDRLDPTGVLRCYSDE
jgi:hypothetical protein